MECGRMYVMNELGVEVRGAHASNRAKRGAASVVVVQRWASPHQDIPVNHEPVFAARFFQYLQKQIAALGRIQKGLTTIATAGYEVQVLGSIIAVQAFGHSHRVTTRV